MSNEALIIFVKNPEKGKVKTRLAADIGEENALKIYLELLRHTKNISYRLPCEKFAFYSESVDQGDLFVDESFQKRVQQGQDLGERMAAAFQEVFELGLGPVCIIGSDCNELQSVHLHEAFYHLAKHDFVVGPAKDGGYYLLGMRTYEKGIFQNVKWSTDTVFADTLEYIKKNRRTYHLLQSLNDVDTVADLGELKKLVTK